MQRRHVLLVVMAMAACGEDLALLDVAPATNPPSGPSTPQQPSTPGTVEVPPAVFPEAAAPIGDAGTSDADADADLADARAPIEGGGACNVRIDAPALAAGSHVNDGTPITYASNPPSSGTHYGSWANFQEFNHPVEDGYLVHALEHGAVLLLYKCDPTADAGACNATIAELRAVRDAVTTDPACSAAIRVRVIIAPRAANDVAIAASAWGHTYRADCVDAKTLGQFIAEHYAKAPEDFCVPGSIF